MAEGRSEGCQATVYVDDHYGAKAESNSSFKCDICGKICEDSNSLSQHALNHTAERVHECQECGKGFKQPSHLHQHMRIHTNERPFPCYLCDKSFKQSCQLKQHLRVHTGDKPYKCDHCDRAFKQRSQVQQHTRLHTGEKPYQCDICQRKFTQASQLKSHKKTHERHARKLNPNLPAEDLPKPSRTPLNSYRRPGRPRKDDVEPPIYKMGTMIPPPSSVMRESLGPARSEPGPEPEPEPTPRYSISSDEEVIFDDYHPKHSLYEHSSGFETRHSLSGRRSSINEGLKMAESQRKSSSSSTPETSPLLKIPNLWFPSSSPHRSPSPTPPQGQSSPSDRIFEVVGAQRKYLGI